MTQVFITVGNGANGNGADGNGASGSGRNGSSGNGSGPAGGTDVHELARWLADEPALRGRVRTGSSGPPVAGAMGTVSDLLTVVLEPGGAATVLIGTVVAWLRGRREGR
ncbi:effector-associated constant component EACC1, partial [Kitasatospora putterlickiae]|uniref:effector-associated constant component EACC1 n=1 Tax=Kitasatospora putterlickiae TaxID=221725 RepID=UPI003CD0C406